MVDNLDSKIDEIYFELPDSSIRGIPLISNEKHLDIGFVEVGCKPSNKRRQLKNKKQLFYKYWGDIYHQELNINWYPAVYRILAHYEPEKDLKLKIRKAELDAIIYYDYITPKMLQDMDDEDKKQVYSIINSKSKKREILEEILMTNDAEKLHKMIVESRNYQQYSHIRGKMAEILVLKDLENSIPPGVNVFRNGDVRYFNRRYRNGTEIDGILTFYGEEKFIELIENLKQLEHLKIKDRWK